MNLDHSLKSGDLKPYENTFRWKRRLAIATTSLMAFIIICIIVAQSIREYKTIVNTDILVLGVNPESVIHQIVGEELADPKLASHIAAAHMELGAITNDDLTEQDLGAIRDAFNFQISKQNEPDRIRLTTEYFGAGTRLEQFLTKQVAQSIGSHLRALQSDNGNLRQLQMQMESTLASIERNSSARHAELIAAHSLIDRLNEGLSDIHNQVELFRPLPPTTENSERDSSAGVSPMRVVNAMLPEQNPQAASIQKSLNELDTDNLQSKLGQIQQNLRNDAMQVRNDIASLDSHARELSESRIAVNSISDVHTQPATPLPGWTSLLLFALAATGIGTAISLFYRPDLEGVGYATPTAVAAGLGLPIVAELKSTSAPIEHPSGIHNVANLMVSYSQIGLFGFVLLIVLLCLLHSDLRTAFVDHPINGLNRLTGVFFGN